MGSKSSFFGAIASTFFALIVCGCTAIGPDFPKADAGFTPKVTYNIDSEAAWTKVISTLGANTIHVEQAQHESGQIKTGYMEGTTTVGLVNGSSRYMYRIYIIPVEKTKTTINVSPVLESSGAQYAQNWNDVSSQNTDIVSEPRSWLYQKIEGSL